MKKEIVEKTPEEWKQTARKKCLDLLMRSEKSEFQLRKKMKEAGIPQDAIEAGIAYANQFHYIDDRRYAESYVRSYKERKSVRMMSFELAQNGVSEDIIREVLEDGSNLEQEAVRRVIAKRLDGKDLQEDALVQKTIRYLAGKGYSFSVIKSALDEYRMEQNMEQ